MNRKLGMIDGSSYGFVVELDGPDLVKDESTRQLLVQRMKKLPSKVNNIVWETGVKWKKKDFKY